MKKSACLFVLVIIQLSVYAASSKNRVQEIMDKYKDSVKNYGVVALVEQNGKVYKGCIGDNYANTPMQADDQFSIASCSKIFTATVVLELAEAHKLSLDDSLKDFDFFSRYPNKNIDSNITIRQLLSHTSGIKDVQSPMLLNMSLMRPSGDYSAGKILEMVNAVSFPKGTKFEYSNTNYFILALIIEEVADMSMEAALDKYIIQKYKLQNTLPYISNNIERLVHPMFVRGKNVQDLAPMPKTGMNSISKGVGNMVTNTEDLNRFLRLLLIDKAILNDTTVHAMTDFDRYFSKYGFGLMPMKVGSKMLTGHTGRSLYVSFIGVDPKTKTSFILLCNNANDEYAQSIYTQLVKAFE